MVCSSTLIKAFSKKTLDGVVGKQSFKCRIAGLLGYRTLPKSCTFSSKLRWCNTPTQNTNVEVIFTRLYVLALNLPTAKLGCEMESQLSR